MFFYNVLSGKKEKFKPLKGKLVRFYTCGPTVYDYAHVGNLRTYVFDDLLRRTLKYDGYKVRQVMNITDVDDKIIKRAQKERKSIKGISVPYTRAFFDDIKKLNIEKAEVYPKATEHIQEMLSLISKLIKKGVAYKGKDGSIYFDISRFKKYGKLSRLQKREIKVGARIEADEYNKEEAQDFVLWKAKKPGEPSWKSRLGQARPGWHIECSAMSMKYLGASFDIHTGAVDLLFPHHENEIAQAEAATGKKFVNYWLEGEHLLINGQKMSKSLKNFFTLRDIEARGFNPLSFKYFTFSTHYRKKLNFTWDGLVSAENALNKLVNTMAGLYSIKKEKLSPLTSRKVAAYKKDFMESVNDDLNIPKALNVLWRIVKDRDIPPISKKELAYNFDEIFGFGLKNVKPRKTIVPLKIAKLVSQREKFRTNKQFIQADALRKEVKALGYRIEDTESGPRIINGNN